MTVGNYERNLSGAGPANLCWLCQPAAACTAAWPSGPSAPSGALDTSWAGSLMGSAREGLRLHARKSSPCSVWCGCEREKVLPASLFDRESAKEFAPRAQIGPNSAFLRLLGEFCRGNATGGAVLGEFCRGNATGGAVPGEFFRGRAAGGAVPGEFCRANWPCAGLGCDAVHFRLAVGVLQH